MKKYQLTLFLILVSAFVSKAQTVLFSKVFRGDKRVEASRLVNDDSSGYVVTGFYDVPTPIASGMLAHCDAAGSLLSAREYSITGNSMRINHTIKTFDAAYLHTGVVENYTTGKKSALIFKSDANGDTIWTQSYIHTNDADPRDIIQTADSGFVFTGNILSTSSDSVFVTKINQNGIVQWNRVLRSPGIVNNYAVAINETSDSGLVIVYSVEETTGSGWLTSMLSKLDKNGTLLWSKNFSDPASYLVAQDADVRSNYIYVHCLHAVYWTTMKLDSSGNIIWQKRLAGTPLNANIIDPFANILSLDQDGYLFMMGKATVHGDMRCAKIDTSGSVLWVTQFNFMTMDAVKSTDNGYAILGNGPEMASTPVPNDVREFTILKLNSAGIGASCTGPYGQWPGTDNIIPATVAVSCVNAPASNSALGLSVSTLELVEESGCVAAYSGIKENGRLEIAVFPNPAGAQVTLTMLEKDDHVSLYDGAGKEIHRCLSAGGDLKIDLNAFPKGIYFYRILNKDHNPVKQGKFLIQ